ncbi:MAG: hypothetical protein ACH350_10270 [Parachlamydiaceae bacterium]
MNKKKANEQFDFADSEFESFHMYDREKTLKIHLTSWDEKELCIVFCNPIQFSFKEGDTISSFYEIENNSILLNEALSLHYAKIPPSHPFKLFQIWDINDFPIISIVAESVSVSKGKEIIGFRD